VLGEKEETKARYEERERSYTCKRGEFFFLAFLHCRLAVHTTEYI